MQTDQKGKKTTRKPSKRRGGQPTKFKKKYCQDLIEHMASGRGLNSFSKALFEKYKVSICSDTFYQWEKDQPLFSYSKQIAQNFREAFWEDLYIAGCAGQLVTKESEELNSEGEVTKKNYKAARFAQSFVAFICRSQLGYVERIEISGKDGEPISFAQLAKKAEELTEQDKEKASE